MEVLHCEHMAVDVQITTDVQMHTLLPNCCSEKTDPRSRLNEQRAGLNEHCLVFLCVDVPRPQKGAFLRLRDGEPFVSFIRYHNGPVGTFYFAVHLEAEDRELGECANPDVAHELPRALRVHRNASDSPQITLVG